MNNEKLQHAMETTDVFEQLQSREQGLTEQEVAIKKEQFGENSLPMHPPTPWWKRLLDQFNNVLIYVLLISAVVSALMQHIVDSAVIVAVVVVNALVGFIQEGKAESALRAIMSMTKTITMVVRNGATQSIDSTALVPGDVVVLQAGDRVPADVRLFFNKNLHCDESALTGEAKPASKHLERLAEKTALAERTNMAFMGTLVTSGLARGIVISTGIQTEIGEISDLVGKVDMPKTPLQLQLTQFAHQLTMGILVISALTIVLGIWLHGFSVNEMFQAAIGIAVSSIPEGLPAIVTIALAIGVQRMSKNNALVRRLPSVEVLGAVDVICSDKTGTLTANVMTAREVFTATTQFKVNGEGYKPEGAIEILNSGEKVLIDHNEAFTQVCTISMLCNDANLILEHQEWTLHGDPTEGALLTLGMKHGLRLPQLNAMWPRLDIFPFESEHRYMATLNHNLDGALRLMVKGAPERLLNYAKYEQQDNQIVTIDTQKWQAAAEDYARRGMRIMAIAYRDLDARPDALSHQHIEQGLIMVGLVGLSDPPRSEAISSIMQCHTAGIRVKMITGDNPITAAAIGDELGLNTDQVLTGADIDEMSQAQLKQAVEQTDIFARTSPSNKLQLVTALQNNQHVVAMTGDGINDAPALKKASIGIAMGNKGTDAAKEASDFILTDDNFATIARAVAEGRTVYDNIVKSIIFILPTNIAEALVIFSAIMLGKMLPITPAQILWVNMITAVTLALSLAFERAEPDIMTKPPRPYGQGLFTPALLIRMFVVGSLSAAIVFFLFYFYRENGSSIEFARTVSVNALVMIEVFYLFNCRYLTLSIFNRDFFKGSTPTLLAALAVILIQIAFTYSSNIQQLFGLEAIQLHDWMMIVFCALPILFIVELEKYMYRSIKK
jgi:magnesium-transporting ATPase (P-type)